MILFINYGYDNDGDNGSGYTYVIKQRKVKLVGHFRKPL